MKNIDSNFLSHLQGNTASTVCNCIEITLSLVSGTYRFTDHYKDIVVDGDTYDSAGGFRLSAIRKAQGNSVDTFTLTNVVSPSGSDFATRAKKKLLENATIRVFLVNFKDPTEYYEDFKGLISRVKPKDFTFDIEGEGLSCLLLQNVMKTYEHSCIWTFGSSQCGFALSGVTVTGSVTGVTNRSVFEDTSRSEADNHFQFGILTWTSGLNSGISREVKSYDGINTEFTLYEPMPYEIQGGDGYSVYQGCDKLVDTCKDDFDNFENFAGYLYKVPKEEDLTWIPPEEDE